MLFLVIHYTVSDLPLSIKILVVWWILFVVLASVPLIASMIAGAADSPSAAVPAVRINQRREE